MEDKLEALASDEKFKERFSATESPEEAAVLLSEYGIEVSAEELAAAAESADRLKDDELDAEALDSVSGGMTWWWVQRLWTIMAPARPRWGRRF